MKEYIKDSRKKERLSFWRPQAEKKPYTGRSAFSAYATEEQKAQVLVTGKPLQARLRVSQPDDPAEGEAERIARDMVKQGSVQRKAKREPFKIQRKARSGNVEGNRPENIGGALPGAEVACP